MRYVIGIDEVGRGSLAGPVVVCAVAIPVGYRVWPLANRIRERFKRIPLRDSKKLSPKQRERWFEYFVQHPSLYYSIAWVYPRRIERMNIAKAANLAALRAFRRLKTTYHLLPTTYSIFLDGGLFLGDGRQLPNVKTVVKGDEKFTSIKIASIIAKVSRDRYMARLAKKHPAYGFEVHKGYGTRAHLAAIRRYGPSEAHRRGWV